MQPIQDNQLDNLFREKFSNAKIVPRAELWNAIAPQLVKPKKPARLPIMWMAAASLATVFTFGLFNKQEKIKLFNPNVEIEAPYFEDAASDPILKDESLPVVNHEMFSEGPTATTSVHAPLKEELQKPISERKTTVIPQEVVVTPLEMQSITLPPVNDIHHNVLETVRTNDVSLADNLDSQPLRKQDRIRNVGDIVNFVVDKLDKRPDKAIKFRTNDDESSIIGFNIGPFKFNQKKK